MGALEQQPNMRVEYDLEEQRVGDMDRDDLISYCWRQAEKDVNRAIWDHNRNEYVEKRKSGEA